MSRKKLVKGDRLGGRDVFLGLPMEGLPGGPLPTTPEARAAWKRAITRSGEVEDVQPPASEAEQDAET